MSQNHCKLLYLNCTDAFLYRFTGVLWNSIHHAPCLSVAAYCLGRRIVPSQVFFGASFVLAIVILRHLCDLILVIRYIYIYICWPMPVHVDLCLYMPTYARICRHMPVCVDLCPYRCDLCPYMWTYSRIFFQATILIPHNNTACVDLCPGMSNLACIYVELFLYMSTDARLKPVYVDLCLYICQPMPIYVDICPYVWTYAPICPP